MQNCPTYNPNELPKGFTDGDWKIVVDTKGVHRWQMKRETPFSDKNEKGKLDKKEMLYEKALMNSRNKSDKLYLSKKLTQIDEQKQKFN
jgi:predicted aminopeptidase